MCLYLNKWYHRIPRISFKPIKVYKVVVNQSNNYTTYYRRTPININDIIKAKGNFFKDTAKGVYSGYLERAYIHYYTSKTSALYYSEKYKFIPAYTLEAYIPPFTLYFKGDHCEGAARRLLITDRKVLR